MASTGAGQINLEFLAIHRSEEHTSELQSQSNLVCRLLLEKTNRKLLEVTHFHLFTMPVVLLIIGHLFLATSLGDRAKLLLVMGASFSAAAHLSPPWIVLYT